MRSSASVGWRGRLFGGQQQRSVVAASTGRATSVQFAAGRRGFRTSGALRSGSNGKIYASAEEAVKDVKDGSKLYARTRRSPSISSSFFFASPPLSLKRKKFIHET